LIIIKRIKLVTPCAMPFYKNKDDALCGVSTDGMCV
jgi:hypothetical protein